MRLDKLLKMPWMSSFHNGEVKTKIEPTNPNYKRVYVKKLKDLYQGNKLSVINVQEELSDKLADSSFASTPGLTWQDRLSVLPNEHTCVSFKMGQIESNGTKGTIEMFIFFEKLENHKLWVACIASVDNLCCSVYENQMMLENDVESTGINPFIDYYVDPMVYDFSAGTNLPVNKFEYNQVGEVQKRFFDRDAKLYISAFYTLTSLLANPKIVEGNLSSVVPPATVVRKAIKRDEFPPVRYKTLNIYKYKKLGVVTGYKFPNRKKPSEHTRRSHLRNINGVLVPVRASIVNKNIGTKIIKDYNLID